MEEENKKNSAKDILEESIDSIKTQKIYKEKPVESAEGNQFNKSQEELLKHSDDLKSEISSDENYEEKDNKENDFNKPCSESVKNSENINEDISKENSAGNIQNNDKNDIKNAIILLGTFILLGPIQFVILYFVKDFIAVKYGLVQSQAWVIYGFSCVFALWISIVSCSYLAYRIDKEEYSFTIFEGIITIAIVGVILGLVCWGIVALIPNFGLLKTNILRFLHLDPFSQGQLGVSYLFGIIILINLFVLFAKLRNKKSIVGPVITLILLVVSLWLSILTMQNWNVIVAFFWDKIFPAILVIGILAIIAMVWRSQFTCPHCGETWALEKIDQDIQDGFTKTERVGNEYRRYRIQHIKEEWRCSKCGGTVIRSREKKIRL